jgi:hypothetical protein
MCRYLRQVYNLYGYVFKYADLTKGNYTEDQQLPVSLRPLVPDGWRCVERASNSD